jgi:hypothetical protein
MRTRVCELLREVVEHLDARQHVRDRSPAALAALVGRDVDLLLDLSHRVFVDTGLGLVEEPELTPRGLLALRCEALGAQQADGFFEKLDAIVLLVDQGLLLFDPALRFFDQPLLREHEGAETLDRIREFNLATPHGPNITESSRSTRRKRRKETRGASLGRDRGRPATS